MSELYLVHHGKKGQKWGERNAEWYPIADYKAHLNRLKKTEKISKTYDKIDSKINKQRNKYISKGQMHKVKIADEMLRRNSEARKSKSESLLKGDKDYEKNSLKEDMKKVGFGEQSINDLSMASYYSRSSEKYTQQGVLTALNKIKDAKLSALSTEDGLKYCEKLFDISKKTRQYGGIAGMQKVSDAENFYKEAANKNNNTVSENTGKTSTDGKYTLSDNGYGDGYDAHGLKFGKDKFSVYGNISDKTEFSKNISKLEKTLNKTGYDQLLNDVAKTIYENKYTDQSSTSVEKIKKNLKMYGASDYGSGNFELHFEHINYGPDAPEGDHSIDFEIYIDENNKIKLPKYYSVNG